MPVSILSLLTFDRFLAILLKLDLNESTQQTFHDFFTPLSVSRSVQPTRN
jgi:hypothetical protein